MHFVYKLDSMLKLGIDLGGTKTEGVVLDEQGLVIERKRVDTGQKKGYELLQG